MFVNTSGNARHGQAFVRSVKDGVEQHIYGSGDDRVVVSNEKSSVSYTHLTLPTTPYV